MAARAGKSIGKSIGQKSVRGAKPKKAASAARASRAVADSRTGQMFCYAVRSGDGVVRRWAVLHEKCSEKAAAELERFKSRLEVGAEMTLPRTRCTQCGLELDPAAAKLEIKERDRKLRERKLKAAELRERRKELALLGKI